MVEFTLEFLDKLKKKKEYSEGIANKFYVLSKNYSSKSLMKGNKTHYAEFSKSFYNYHTKMKLCCDEWQWDKYEKNKILDLQKVKRCKNKFCFNCRTLSLHDAIIELKTVIPELMEQYDVYLMTMTVPNVTGDMLNTTVDMLYKRWKGFYDWFSTRESNNFKNRFFTIYGAIRVLEINSKHNEEYHPHFHVLVLADKCKQEIFKKNLTTNCYRSKSKEFIKLSLADMQIMSLWHMSLLKKNISSYSDYENLNFEKLNDLLAAKQVYTCDIRPLKDEKGIYEVLKYTFKASDIKTVKNLEDIFFSLHKRRARESYGVLKNLKNLETDNLNYEINEDIIDYLEIDKEEEPEKILTNLKELNKPGKRKGYLEYKKISRHKVQRDTIKNLLDLV